MKHENEVTLHDRLDAVKEAFKQWRNTRTTRGPIPEDLWQAAVELLDSYTPWKITRELKLDYNQLKRRIRERSPQSQPSQFIEVHMDRTLPVSQCTLHLRSPAGFELTVQGCSTLEFQLPQLIARFLSQSR